ncbi:MAG: hypothetical protein ACR2HN_05525 [Tepidiformaceae bacterium]
MTARGAAAPGNPLHRLADAVPGTAAGYVSIVARVLGAAAALYYAYDQDQLFPTDHFPRTWAFVIVVAAIAIASTIPLRGRFAPWLAALGCGVLVFAGAILSHQAPGIVVLVAGVVAWVAFAIANHQRGGSIGAAVSGLFMGSLLSFLLVGAIVLAIEG